MGIEVDDHAASGVLIRERLFPQFSNAAERRGEPSRRGEAPTESCIYDFGAPGKSVFLNSMPSACS